LQAETLLLRQVHPSFVQDGRPSSQAFRPTKKDDFKLSAYHGDMIEPEPSWKHYTTKIGWESAGVLAVAVGECAGEQLPVEHDGDPYAEHCFIDFRNLTRSELTKKADNLAALARGRGWLFTAP
jgi:hypothetical protein